MPSKNNKDLDASHSGPSYILILSVVLIANLAVTVFLRSHTFEEPLEADEAIYSIIAQDWIDGGKPYVTLWDNKPIGTFVIYRVAITLFGYNEYAPKILATLSVVFCTLLLCYYFIATRHSMISTALLLFLWSLFSGLWSCHANGANSEVFILPFLLAAYLTLRQFQSDGRYIWLIIAYVIIVLSVVVKQVTIPFLIIPFLLISKETWRRWNVMAGILCAAGIVAIAIHVLIYTALGYSPSILIEQFNRNSHHVTSEVGNSIFKIISSLIMAPFDTAVMVITPLILTAIAGAIWAQIAKPRRYGSRLVLYFMAAVGIAIAIPGSNMPHYYILLLPFTVIGISIFCKVIDDPWRTLTLIAFCAYLLGYTYQYYLRIHPNEISYSKYGNNNWFVRDRFIGKELAAKGITGEEIYIDGTHPGIYFYSGNSPATRYFVAWNYVSMDVTSWGAVFDELKTAAPKWCVLLNPAHGEFEAWIHENYELHEEIAGGKIFIRRIASARL